VQLTTLVREIISSKFTQNSENKEKLQFFYMYFQDAMAHFEDKRLRRELKLLQNLSGIPSSNPPPSSNYSSAYSRPANSPTVVPPYSFVAPTAPTTPPTPSPSPAPAETEIPAPKDQENAAEGAIDLCLICLAKTIKTVNIPCGHRVYCLTCVQVEKQQKKATILSCPTCRAQLTKVMETF